MRIDIELLRIISALGIVWFHSGNLSGREIAYGGLIFFVIISSYLATISRRKHSSLNRFQRLIIPGIIWSILYGLLNLLAVGKICPQSNNFISSILSTPSTHLWYLPYMYIVLITLDRIKMMFSKTFIGLVSGTVAIALLLLSPIWRTIELMSPFELYTHAFPAVLIGIYLGCHEHIAAKLRLSILSGIIVSILLMVFISVEGMGIPYFFGFTPCLLLLRSDIFQGYKLDITPISSLTFGVYLIHWLFLLILWKLGFTGYILPIIVFPLSLLCIFTLKKILPKHLFQYVA
ncbi:MAG: hypothetical protein Tsb0014_46070 [Pleurocapsa sp.]